jgi:intracellular growth IglE-like protein
MDPIRAALIACVVALSGCYSTLVLHTQKHANDDRRFYVVVRQVPEAQFQSEPYQKIADIVFPTAPDDSTRAVQLVAPGRVTTLRVRVRELLKPLDKQQSVAVYALVSEPGEAWKVLLTPPLLPRYDFDVVGNRLMVRAPR